MKIQKIEHIDKLSDGTSCDIFYLEIIIDDVYNHANELIIKIKDNSWINELDSMAKISYQRKVSDTAKKLEEIFKTPIDNTSSKLSEEFGEYMISLDSSESLKQSLNHKVIPLAELWKEKITGNHGFDFHTESPQKTIAFGEAKYRSTGNAYGVAARQVKVLIEEEKDKGDVVNLMHLGVSEAAINNLVANKRDFVLAYSVNSCNLEEIKINCLNNENVKFLNTQAQTLYLIGVHIK